VDFSVLAAHVYQDNREKIHVEVVKNHPEFDANPEITRRWTAYHEAGHAFMDLWYGLPFRCIWLLPLDEIAQASALSEPSCLGEVVPIESVYDRLRAGEVVPETAVHQEIESYLSGYVVEMLYRREPLTGLIIGSDTIEACKMLYLWEQAQPRITPCTAMLVEPGGAWRQIIGAPIELPPDVIPPRYLLELLDMQTNIERFFRRRLTWHAVKALARALLGNGLVGYEDANTIVVRAYGPTWNQRPIL
jgi:hypothetical protein